jgi:uncharacterized protein YecE (DUF72 family)
LLVQLPPGFAFDERRVAAFLKQLRGRTEGDVACEPRHRSWFTAEAERLLSGFRIARVAADPAVVPAAAEPGGWPGLAYHRLHGSPRMYRSPYPPEYLNALERRLSGTGGAVWCIFDNTAEGWATHDALLLQHALGPAAGLSSRVGSAGVGQAGRRTGRREACAEPEPPVAPPDLGGVGGAGESDVTKPH